MGFLVGSYCHKINPQYSLATELLFSPNQFTGAVEPNVSLAGLW